MGSDSDRGKQSEIEELGDTEVDSTKSGTPPGAVELPGRYVERGVLGRGGMGEVLLCEDTAIGREIAVKVSRFGVDADDRGRFTREALVQARLEHPAIVPVYDIGAIGSDRPFFTMKRVTGTELGRSDLSRHRSLAAFILVCQAVDYAHNRGVLHRDLKPANLMVGELGEVYVLDWGLAKVSGEPAIDEARPISDQIASSETRADVILGTPGYIAPERLYGDLSDHRADVFALGCILFELLAGRSLHRGPAIEAVLDETVSGEPAAKRIDELEPSVGPELAAICRRATAVDPVDRYQSAGDLWRDVESYLEGDRDLARRRDLAGAATERARELIEGGAIADEGARSEALASLGQALALDPDSVDARAALVGLLIEPPAEVPPEVEAEVEASSMETIALMSRLGTGAFVYTLALFWVIVAILGVERWLWVIVTFVALIAIVSMAAVGGWLKQPFWLYVATIAVIGGLVFSVARLVSPLVLAPVLAPGYVVLLSLHYRDVARYLANAVLVVAVALPLFLEMGGVLSPTFEFVEGGLLILPQSLGLPPIATPLIVCFLFVTSLLAPSVIMGRIKNNLLDAERRARVQTWQLEKLVPTTGQ